MMPLFKKQSGQSLAEVVVALGVAVVVLGALVGLVIRSLSNAQFAKNQIQANKYAQDAIEQVRAIRDNKINIAGSYTFSKIFDGTVDCSVASGGCYYMLNTALDLEPTVSYFVAIPSDQNFSRQIKITGPTNGLLVVDVLVQWTDGSGSHQSNLQTYLGNY